MALITAKLLALLIYTVIFSVVLALLIACLSVVSSLIAGVDIGFTGGGAADAARYTLRYIVASLPIILFAFLLATVARSNAAGIAGALGLSFIEPVIFGILGTMSDRFASIEKGGIAWNTQEIMGNWSGSSANWISMGVLAVYALLFGGPSYIIFLQQDVTSG